MNSSLGTDVSAVSDLDAAFGVVSERLALAQALARRFGTPRGELAHIGDDPSYGYDLREQLNDDTGPRAPFEIAANAEREALKDERVLSARATATLTSGRLLLTLAITDASGPFRLVLAASAVTVEILKVQ